MAAGFTANAIIDTVGVHDELHAIQGQHLDTFHLAHRIRRHTGKAMDVLQSGVLFKTDARPLDVVFVDADKEHQQAYVDWAIEHVRDGGWIVVDNVLWWGEVLRVQEGTSQDPYAVRIHELNAHMKGHPELDNVLLPLRDGLHVARRRPRV